MGQIPVNAGEKQAFPPVDPSALDRPSGSQRADVGPRHDRTVTAAGPAASRPESGEGLKRPRAGRSGPLAEASGRRITQKMVNQMVELRRQGFTYKEIAERIGCSERTVRRYVGHVRVQVEAPREPEPEGDLDRIRFRITQQFTSMLEEEFEVCPSVTLIDEANRRLEVRLADTHAETLKLMAHNQTMRLRLFYEVVGPLEQDLARSDPSGRNRAAEALPIVWHPLVFRDPTLTWQPEWEADDEPAGDTETGRREGLP